MTDKFVMIIALVVCSVSCVAGAFKDRVLADSDVSRWRIPAPEVLSETNQVLTTPTNMVNKSYLSAELTGWTNGEWNVQVYETIKKMMYVQDGDEARFIAEGVLKSKSPVCSAGVTGSWDNGVQRGITAFADKKFVLAQMEYVDMNPLQGGQRFLSGPYVKKQVFVAKDQRSVAITLSFVDKPRNVSEGDSRPTITRFFEVQGNELRNSDDMCATNDLVYTFADTDSSGNPVVYFGYAGYHSVIRCDKRDLQRYVEILSGH